MNVLVLGAGQLARMMALAGAPLNIAVTAFDVRSSQVQHPVTGQVLGTGLAQALTACDVVTAEFEHIPHPILDQCQASGKFYPGSNAIKAGGDRRLEKQLLEGSGVANAPHAIVTDEGSFHQALDTLGAPLILKSALEGYDGKGQWRLQATDEAPQLWPQLQAFLTANPHQAIVAEQMIPFRREVSLVGARNSAGQQAFYPLTENHHANGVLALSRALPAAGALQQQAEAMFSALVEELGYVGVLAIEFFELDGKLLVNEIAPRVHNSGHWTQQGADTCQFENHLRAVCNLPLGNTALVRPTAMVNILGEDQVPEAVLALSNTHVHWYGKEKRPGRKMGHINVSASDDAGLKQSLQALSAVLPAAAFPTLARTLQSL